MKVKYTDEEGKFTLRCEYCTGGVGDEMYLRTESRWYNSKR